MTEFLNQLLSIGAILILLISFLGFLGNYIKQLYFVTNILAKNKILAIGLFSLAAAIGSLIYSIGIGYPPCNLCWYQRVFIFGTAIVAMTSVLAKKSIDLVYIWVLTIIGFIISLYHNLTYYTSFSPLPCDATVSCTARYVHEYGFMSIPLMALMLFVSVMFILGARNTISASLE